VVKLGGVELLTLTNARDGSEIIVEVDPSMTASELAEKLRSKGVIGDQEAVSFGIIDKGRFSPRQIGTARDLIEAARTGKVVAFHALRIQGLTNYISELCSAYGFRWNPVLNGYLARYVSRYDGEMYLIVIECAKIFQEPPTILIFPYPNYVQEDPKFEAMHVSSCLQKKTTNTGSTYGVWHIDEENWNIAIKENRDPMVLVLESLTQLLGLYPSF